MLELQVYLAYNDLLWEFFTGTRSETFSAAHSAVQHYLLFLVLCCYGSNMKVF